MLDRNKVKDYMTLELEFCRDGFTWEINTTQLAELAADEFDEYDSNGDPTEELFEIALEVKEEIDGTLE